MPPTLAFFVTVSLVAFLFRRDYRQRPRVTHAMWIPLLWMLIIGSRFVSEWVGFGGIDLAEGSPLDAAVFLSLQLAGLFVLLRRRVSWSAVISANIVLALFLGYAALSILWSDFPFVAFKRWLKVLGHPIMALVIATEPDPREALSRLMKRCAYILVPFSILLIKYYPELGRGFSEWTGEAFNTGVTTNKNALGYLCLLFGLFFVSHLFATLRRPISRERKSELMLTAAFLVMLAWLLKNANSATSLMALVVGIGTLLVISARSIDKRHVGAYLVTGLALYGAADFLFGVTDMLIRVLGRDSTLTGRVQLWDDVLRFKVNPIFGAGFESFWLGPRLEWFWAKYWWHPNQAHNGYLETYLNLGWIGIILLATWIVTIFQKTSRALLSDPQFGRFALPFLVALVVYNYTEATFKALHVLWFALYIVAVEYPRTLRMSPDGKPSGDYPRAPRSWPKGKPSTPISSQPSRVLRNVLPRGGSVSSHLEPTRRW